MGVNLHFEQSEPPYPLLHTQVSGAMQVPCTHCCAHTGTHVLPLELRVYPWQHTLTVRTLEIIWNEEKIGFCYQCCGSEMFIQYPIPDSNFFHPGSQILDPHQRYLSILTQKIVSKLAETWSGLLPSPIRIPDPDFLPIPVPGSRGQKDPDPDPQFLWARTAFGVVGIFSLDKEIASFG